jgi:hypothetical protein
MQENCIHLPKKRFCKTLAFALPNTGYMPQASRGVARRKQGGSVMRYLECSVRAIYLSVAIPGVVALLLATALVDDTFGLARRR